MDELQVIKDYIDSEDISEEERRFLINYLVNVMRSETEKSSVDFSSVMNDVRKLNDHLQGVDETSLVRERINDELDILNILMASFGDETKVIEASYRLDQLYYKSDMPFRNTDTVVKKAMETKNGRGK